MKNNYKIYLVLLIILTTFVLQNFYYRRLMLNKSDIKPNKATTIDSLNKVDIILERNIDSLEEVDIDINRVIINNNLKINKKRNEKIKIDNIVDNWDYDSLNIFWSKYFQNGNY